MAERSDDIKQLFAHLGLNPNDYQEVRATRRGAPPGTPPEPGSTQAEKLPPSNRLPPLSPPAPLTPPVAPALPPVSAPQIPEFPAAHVSVPAALRPSTMSPESGNRRWPLLQALSESPPKPAQFGDAPSRAVPLVRPRSEEATLIKPRHIPDAIQPLPENLAAGGEERPTKALFAELQRVSERAATARVAEAKRRMAASSPVIDAPQPEKAKPAMQEPRSAQNPRTTMAPVSPPRAQVPPPRPVAPAAPVRPSTKPVTADMGLASTFKRLVQPAGAPGTHSGKLRLNYGSRQPSEAAPPAGVRIENIGDVFNRIASPLPRSR